MLMDFFELYDKRGEKVKFCPGEVIKVSWIVAHEIDKRKDGGMAYITDLYLKGIRKGNVEIDKIYKNCLFLHLMFLEQF